MSTPERQQSTMGRALADRALAMTTRPAARSAQPGVLDLTTPETVQPPEHVRQAAKDALDRGETHYTARPGVPELRRAIAARSAAEGFPATVDSVVVTNGGAEALYIALQSALRPGERVLVGGPVAPNVMQMIAFIGATVQHLPVRIHGRFVPAADDLSVALPTGARALLLASPSPVSGVAIPNDVLERLLRVALENGLTVILDRTHATCCYDLPLACFSNPDLGARVLTTGSFSTGHGLTGWRVGWFSAPAEHIATMRELKQAMSICTSAISQYAALAALEGPQEWLDARRALFAQRRDAAIAELTGSGLPVIAPDAYPALLIDTRPIDEDHHVVAARLRDEHGVHVTPGSTYGVATAGHVRITLAAPGDTLLAGIVRLARLLA